MPVAELFRTHTWNTMLGLGARYIEGVTFNIYGVFLVFYLTSALHMTRQTALDRGHDLFGDHDRYDPDLRPAVRSHRPPRFVRHRRTADRRC